MADTNPFEVLEREKSSPAVKEMEVLSTPISGRTSEASPVLEFKGDQLEPTVPIHVPEEQHAPATPGREPAPEYKVDVQKAPGTISYAEAAKEHKDAAGEKAGEALGAAEESAADAGQAAKEAAGATRAKAGEAAETVQAKAGEAAETVQAKAGQAAETVRSKAGEAAEAAKETAVAAKERTAEATQAAREKAGELAGAAREQAEHAKQVAGEYAEAAKERGADVVETAKEYAQVAAEKTSDIASAAGEQVKSAVEFVKEHLPSLPRMERAESTPEERQSKALLEEALALAEGGPGGATYYPTVRPELYAPPAPAAETEPAPRAAAAAPGSGAGGAGEAAAAGPGPGEGIKPASVEDLMPGVKESAADAAHRMLDTAAEVGRTTLEGGKEPDTATLAPSHGTPDELQSRAEREEISAQGPLQALAEKVKGAVERVKEHLPGFHYRHEEEDTAGGTLPQTHPQAPSPQPSSPPASPRGGRVREFRALPGDIHIPLLARAAREALPGHKEPAEAAKGAVDKAEAKVEGAKEAASAKASEAHHTVTESLSEAVHTVEDKAKWVVDHTKQEMHKSAREWQEENRPHSLEEAKRAHGEVPSDTESILRARGQLPPLAGAEPVTEPETGAAAAEPPAAVSGLSRLTPEVVKESAKEALQALDRHHPGEEGEAAA